MIDFVTIAKSTNIFKIFKIRVPEKTGSRIRNFFGLKPSRDQDGANKKKFSQIGPAVPEEIGRKQTDTQTSCCYIREIMKNGSALLFHTYIDCVVLLELHRDTFFHISRK